ncbi:MAG: tail tape measure protein [Lokiarchaeia virus VerdaV1]|uniref:Tail tape measure protein n=1 Tax=Lokiarchaeia virus VerdaV1 TaxID=3070170 RepID=A0AA35CPH6_9CAUD|nr:MAG: tail tape measure protein [Lokiarchaeia virus VerdaV1]BDI54863.1 MAG: tail tape measure protein [Lokiarchaeia virus VerdaV1]
METLGGQKPAKVEKAAKETKGMFQTLIGASLGPVGAILKFLESLKPFMAIIKIVQGLFKALMGEAFKPIIEVLKPIFGILIGFMPIFKALGKIIGVLISFGLIPLRVAFALIEKFLTPLLPYIEWFADLMGELMIYIDPLIDLIVNGLLVAIKWIWFGIASFINGIISLINLIPGVNISLIPLPTFKYGGVMPHTGYAWLEKNEVILSPTQLNNMYYEQQETNRLLKHIIRDRRII